MYVCSLVMATILCVPLMQQPLTNVLANTDVNHIESVLPTEILHKYVCNSGSRLATIITLCSNCVAQAQRGLWLPFSGNWGPSKERLPNM